jgi:hypothetical protein
MPVPRSSQPGGRLRGALCVAVLAALILGVHGQSSRFGLFMDDHAHFEQLRACGWSLSELTDACRLELVGGAVEYWWLPDVTLRFFRPVAFGIMKLSYTLVGWNAPAMHVLCLAWHLLACSLLVLLLRRCGATLPLATCVAGLFAIHPGHVATVQWIACQTELMVTVFLLGATLCFGRFRGWPGFVPDKENPRRTRWAVGSAVLFALALGCRENAVMFPLVMACVEPLVWSRRSRGMWILYAAFGGMLVGYLVLRGHLLGGTALPPRPYVFPPTDPDFPRFVFDKTWYYLLGQFLLVPCVPIAGVLYFQERPLLFYSLAAVVGLLLLLVCLRFWRRAPGVIGPAWLVGFAAPVLPVFASPHHLYMPGIGWALTLMVFFRGLANPRPTVGRVHRYARRIGTWTVLIVMLLLFARTSTWFGLALEAGHGVERCFVEELASSPKGLHDGDTLYVANLPLIGHYARLVLEEQTGRRNLRVIPLTWAPRLLGPARPAELTWVDDRTIDMRVEDDRYFAGTLGRIAREVRGSAIPDEADFTDTYGFRVTVLERDRDGIAALRFRFARPLTDPDLHLFWGSRVCWAYEVTPPEQP